jgi:hypothetical protein
MLLIATYEHEFGCSVTGGHVFRGDEFPDMAGLYFFGDFCSGRIWSLVAATFCSLRHGGELRQTANRMTRWHSGSLPSRSPDPPGRFGYQNGHHRTQSFDLA